MTEQNKQDDRFYRPPAAPIRARAGVPGMLDPGMHYVERAESAAMKGACRCGHWWETGPHVECVRSAIQAATTKLDGSPALPPNREQFALPRMCPACPVCTGIAKRADSPLTGQMNSYRGRTPIADSIEWGKPGTKIPIPAPRYDLITATVMSGLAGTLLGIVIGLVAAMWIVQ